MHAAPALGLTINEGTSVDVDVFTGSATLRETDASLTLGLGLRRARTGDAQAPGLFGKGWRSEADASLHRVEGGFAMRRVEGVVLFGAVKEGLWGTLRGEHEWLTRTPEGYEVMDPAGRLHRFDADGRLTELLPGFKVQRAPGELRLIGFVDTITLALDAQGRATRATGRGVDLTYEYDARGDLTAVRGTREARYVHQDGRVVEVHGRRGRLLALAYDEDGRVARLNDRVYRFFGREAEVCTPRGTWRYTAERDGWRVQSPWGNERVVVDGRGRILSVQREGEPEHHVERDRHGRVVLGVKSNAVREVEHDARALVDAVTTAGGRRWTFTRDANGQVVGEDGPAGAIELTRDAAGRRASRRDATGREVTAIRDTRGQLEELVAGEGTAIAFTHDDAGRLLSAGGDADPVSFTWDPVERDRLLAVETPDTVLRYTHGPNVERVDTPWGTFVRARDARGRVERLETPAGTFAFEHDAAGRRVGVEYPNGVVTRFERDARGRVTSIAASSHTGPVLSLAHERADDGRITATTRDGATTRFGHDAHGRLTSATGAGGTRRWTIDGDGVREQDGLEHDASGRLVRRTDGAGETRYAYDAFGRLVEVTRVEAGDSRLVRYAYDGLGRVVARTTDEGTTRYLYERGQRLAELGPGDRVRVWIHGPSTDEPLAYIDVIEGEVGDWVYLHADALGTVLAYSDEEGAAVDRVALDPWGEVLEAPEGDRALLFAGRLVDVDTGLVDLRARFYAPDLGRFLDADPTGLDGGPAPHVYADGRPLDRRDPLGLWPWETEGTGDDVRPAAVETAASSLLGWLIGAAIDVAPEAAALATDAGDLLQAGGAALRDARLQLVKSGMAEGRGSGRIHGSEWMLVNLLGDAGQTLGEGALSLGEGTLSTARELITPGGNGEGVAQAFGEGYEDAALGWGTAIREGQAKQVRRLDALMDAGHSPTSAFLSTAGVLVGETVIPVVPAWEAATGCDFSARVDDSTDRRLTTAERVGRVAEVAADLIGAGVAAKANRAAKAAKAADALADATRARRAAHADDALAAAPAPRAPHDGLAQVVNRETPRGARPAPDAPAAQPRAPPAATAATADDADCVFVAGEDGGFERLGNFIEEPTDVLAEVSRRKPTELFVTNLEEARALKSALARDRRFPRPRIYIGRTAERAAQARDAMRRAELEAARATERSAKGPQGTRTTRPLRGRQAARAASELGFDRRVADPPFSGHGQPVFSDGRRYITPDVDQHRGGVWKVFDRAGRRVGTYDRTLTQRLGD